MRRLALLAAGFVAVHTLAASGSTHKSIMRNSKHDFSVSSTATIRASAEPKLCVFCHTPHEANPTAPLWNRRQWSVTNYGLYSSTTLKATVTQPTSADSSKLCLSCHDGTVALGATMNDGVIVFAQGPSYMLPSSSPSNIHKGTGFGDDHPFAFTPLTGAEIQNPPVNDPVKLDVLGKVQCVTCHDPHAEFTDATVGKFLVKNNSRSAICLTCHTKIGWDAASHRQPASPANDARYTVLQGAHTGYTGVANNGCESCHRPHSPSVGPRLVKASEENVCYPCHNGAVAERARNIQSEFQSKIYKHPVLTTPSVHDASESPTSAIYRLPESSAGAPRHSECADCHNPHAANATTSSPPFINGFLRNVWGINASGRLASPALYQFEICFKCHGDSANKPQYFDIGNTGIGFGRNPQRQVDQGNPDRYNVRLEYASTVSWHPVTRSRGLSTGRGGEIPSLRPYIISSAGGNMTSRPLNANSLIYCTDCHNSSSGRNLAAGQTAAAGPHGSDYPHLLERQYRYNTPPASPGQPYTEILYSNIEYALCNKCHDLNSITRNESFKEHDAHVDSAGASCSVCHDPHGLVGGNSTNNSHLINFDLSIVGPDSSGRLRYEDTGFRSGRCYLTCHGKDHNPWSY